MISETVNIPANDDFSLFHSGAETTPTRMHETLENEPWSRNPISKLTVI